MNKDIRSHCSMMYLQRCISKISLGKQGHTLSYSTFNGWFSLSF